eukprot:jgi/Orpsp1_1/1192747/evm.model.d7180000095592.1
MNDKYMIQNEYLLSHLTDWNQFFIDNLNGKKMNIGNFINATNIDLYMNDSLINLEEELKNNIFRAFSYIKYSFKVNFSHIENERYVETVCDFIINNEILKKKIQNSILAKINALKENIILTIFKNYTFEENDVDFTNVIIKNMKSLYFKALTNTIMEIERQNIISTLIINKNENFKDIYKDIFNNLSTTITELSVFSREKIDLILGLSIPCIISKFKEISMYIKRNLYKDYIDNEYKFNPDDKENIYLSNKEYYEENIQKEFKNNKFFIETINIFNSSNKNLLTLFFNDYIIYYISKSDKEFLNIKIIKIFNTMYKLFIFDNNFGNIHQDLLFENITKFILFIE